MFLVPFETALSPNASPRNNFADKAQFLPLTSGCQEAFFFSSPGVCKPTVEAWRTNGSQDRTHLYPAQAGLNLKLFHHLACLANTHSAVNGGLPFHPGVKTDNSVPSAEAIGSSATTQLGLCPNILCPQYLHSPVAIPFFFFFFFKWGEWRR